MDQALIEVLIMTGLLVFSSFLGVYTINLVQSDTQYVRSMNIYYVRSIITSTILDSYARLSNSTLTPGHSGKCVTTEIVLSQPLYLEKANRRIIIKDTFTSKESNITSSMLEDVFNDMEIERNLRWSVVIGLGGDKASMITQDLLIDICLDEASHEIDLTFYKPSETG